MAVFRLLPLQEFDTLLQHLDLPFQVVCVRLQALDRQDGFCQGFMCGLLLLLELEYFLVFLVRNFPLGASLRSQLNQFFFLRHASTLQDAPLILQLHTSTE